MTLLVATLAGMAGMASTGTASTKLPPHIFVYFADDGTARTRRHMCTHEASHIQLLQLTRRSLIHSTHQ